MARPLTLTQIVAAYRKWHVPHKVYPGAGTRGRPGGITDAIGITEHHTGGGSASSSYLYFLFVSGRASEGIPGPLCSEATDSGGTVWIGAVGRANHAGMGSSVTRDRVRAESYPGYTSELRPGPDAINGNPLYYGNEWIYSGTRPPTAAQYRAAVLAAAARCDAHGWSALSAFAHREHSRRKGDPYGVSMAQFRRDVRACLDAGPAACVQYVATGKLVTGTPTKPPATDTPTGDSNMADWTEAQLRAMMQAEEEEYAIRFWIAPSGTGTALRNQVTYMLNQQAVINNKLDQLLGMHESGASLDAVPAAVVELNAAMEDAVNQLAAAPEQARLTALLNADGTVDPTGDRTLGEVLDDPYDNRASWPAPGEDGERRE